MSYNAIDRLKVSYQVHFYVHKQIFLRYLNDIKMNYVKFLTFNFLDVENFS
jgi:hypothetical protein